MDMCFLEAVQQMRTFPVSTLCCKVAQAFCLIVHSEKGLNAATLVHLHSSSMWESALFFIHFVLFTETMNTTHNFALLEILVTSAICSRRNYNFITVEFASEMTYFPIYPPP